jgi:hypothetical protein
VGTKNNITFVETLKQNNMSTTTKTITPNEFEVLIKKTYFKNVNNSINNPSCTIECTDDEVVINARNMISAHYEEVFKLCDVFNLSWVLIPNGEWLKLMISF